MSQAIDRRMFLGMMAGAAAGATHVVETGDRRPDRWVSYVTEESAAAQETWSVFATTCRECPAGCGMHVRCSGGRVVKAEGNADHPVSHGGLCPRGQSAPQGLYDPDRLRRPLRAVEPRAGLSRKFEPLSWTDVMHEVAIALTRAKRLFLVSDLQTGALAQAMQQFHAAMGRPGEVVFYEAFAYEALRAANKRLFSQAVTGASQGEESRWGPIPRYRLQQCDLILSFGVDFLETWISNVEFAWQFAQMHHRQPNYRGEMVYIGPRLSMTAANADHFLQVRAGQEYRVAAAVLEEVARLGKRTSPVEPTGPIEGVSSGTIRELAQRLARAKNSVVLGGPVAATGPAAERLATAVMLLNQAVGSVGDPASAGPVDFSQVHALGRTIPTRQLDATLADLEQGDLLIFHETNPAYSLPSIRQYLERAGRIIYLGTMMNETAAMADWVLPVLSPLEMWGDYEPWTGTHCLMQPTMGSLYDVWHSGDILLTLASMLGRPLDGTGQEVKTFRDWLRLSWRRLHERISPDLEFETFWQQSLQRGGAFEEVAGAVPGPLSIPSQQSPIDLGQPQGVAPTDDLHLWLWPSILLYDGRLSNRGWLQEVPDRMSTVAWQSWVDISPARAGQLQVTDGDVLEVSSEAGEIRAPARVTDEVADNVVGLAFGQGHTSLGETANGRGVNAFELLIPGEEDSLFGAVSLRKTGEREHLTTLSATQDQHERDIIQWITPQALRAATESDKEEIFWPLPRGYDPHRDLYPPHEYPKHRWAMVVDLDRCIGCGACEVACYAENNIPLMGAVPLMKHRQMAWLQIPPYRHSTEPLRTGFLPLPCQHCDAAPCEPVCPVFASVHNDQGLNAQVYNRCIGTRYCSNNCPYKVRRFEWFNPQWRKPLHLQLNPDVDVRCRGVMEKCTFCVQRILHAERRAKVEGRPLRDGEIQPACVQSCPAKALAFGDLMQPDSQVSKLFEHPRRYQLLKELNTKPAVLYLKRILPDKTELI